MAEPALETEALTRRFGALAAVDAVSLRVERGAAHAVIGPNGAGKSTLLSVLSGELRASAGRIRLHGRDVTRASPDAISRMGVGRSYQSANVFAPLTCAECVWLAAQSRARPAMAFLPSAERDAAIAARAARALEVCGLAERRLVQEFQRDFACEVTPLQFEPHLPERVFCGRQFRLTIGGHKQQPHRPAFVAQIAEEIDG